MADETELRAKVAALRKALRPIRRQIADGITFNNDDFELVVQLSRKDIAAIKKAMD